MAAIVGRRVVFCLTVLPNILANACAAHVTEIGGVRLRRVQASSNLPWVLEADWEATAAAAAATDKKEGDGIDSHDPLSSCYWPAAAALARTLGALNGGDAARSYLELGCGTGLVSLTAAACGARSVLATDVSSTSLQYTAAAADAQGLTAVTTSIFDATDLAVPLPHADVLLLSDVFVTDALAVSFAARVAEAVDGGAFLRVLVVDPGRSTRDTFLTALAAHGVRHDGFMEEAALVAHARQGGNRVCLLDTSEGTPVSYCI